MAKISATLEANALRIRDLTSAPTTGFDATSGSGFDGHGIFYMVGGQVYFKNTAGTEFGPLGSSSVAALADLTDVGVTTPTNGNVLVADGDSWESQAFNFDLVSDVTLTTPAKGHLLAHNGTVWVNLAPGTDGFVLKANSGAAEGVNWAAESGGGATLTYTRGDDLTGIATLTGSVQYMANLNFTDDPDTFEDVSNTDRCDIPAGEGGRYLVVVTFGIFEAAGTGSGAGFNLVEGSVQKNGTTGLGTANGFLNAADTGANEVELVFTELINLVDTDYIRFGARILAGSDTLDAEVRRFHLTRIA